jgi:hypothetical protein
MQKPFYLMLILCLLLMPLKPSEALAEDNTRWETSSSIRAAIKSGCKQIVASQHKDGYWAAHGQYKMAMTSMSALALLSAGSTTERGEYATQVRKATNYILRFCNRRTLKKLNGLITAQGEGRPMYGHGFAVLYLAQLYGTSADPELNKKIRDALRYGVKLIDESQSKEGGWYYSPGDRHDEGSVTITQIQALRAAQNVGVTVNKRVIDKALDYLKKSQNADGGIKYSLSMGGGGSRPSLAAAGLACFFNCGVYEGKAVDKLTKYIKRLFNYSETTGRLTMPSNHGHFMYTQHYASQAIFFIGGRFWKSYFKMISAQLVRSQSSNGSWGSNSWNGGDTFGTATGVLILTVPYRFLPINQR